MVSIIIVNYNLTGSVRALLNSIKKFVRDIEFEVIVVDNNSPDRSIEDLQNEFPKFKFVFLETNFGFGHGNNVGFSNSRGEYLLLLNPDTFLVNNLPYDLYCFAKKNLDFGIIGPLMVFPNGNLQVSAAKFPNLKQEIGNLTGLLGYMITYIAAFKNWFYKRKYYEVDFVFGSCMLINSKLFKELNGFDEDYFLITEETDLCYRTRKQTDYKIVYFFGAKIVHIKSLATGKNMLERLKQSYISKLIFFRKHYSKSRALILENFIVLMFAIRRFFLIGMKNDKSRYWETYSDIINHYRKN